MFDAGLNKIRDAAALDVTYSVKKSRKKVFAIIIDGTANKAIVKTCEEKGVEYLCAKNFSYAEGNVHLISL